MITQEQFAELESAHGAGMVLVLSVGDDEFAFRRPSEADVEFAMDERARGVGEWMEHALISCALSHDVPTVNRAPSKDSKPVVCPELIAVREQIQAIWKEAPFCRDWVPLAFLHSCGLVPVIDQKPLGGGRYSVTIAGEKAMGSETWSYVAEGKVLSGNQYERLRKLSLSEGIGGDKFAFESGILSFAGIARDEFAKRYPFAVLALGQLVRAFGSESRAVSVKKFSSGSAPQPGNSTDTPANT